MAVKFNAVEAIRENVWVKLALMGPSGSGKTYSALKLASGMLAQLKARNLEIGNGKILLGNSEGPRGKYYAKEFKFDIVDLVAPYTPEMHVDFIEYAVAAGYPVVIIDSTSHEWEGIGGCLDISQQAGGTYQSWAKVTPRHNKFIEAIAMSPIHIIATMRGKDQYEVDATGPKQKITKLGVGAQQRNGFEYDFTSTFSIEQAGNMATSQKDNTHLFEAKGPILLDEKHGKWIVDWANDGSGYNVAIREVKAEGPDIDALREQVIALCKVHGGSGNPALMTVVKKYNEKGNPNAIKDVEAMGNLLTDLQAFSVPAETKSE